MLLAGTTAGARRRVAVTGVRLLATTREDEFKRRIIEGPSFSDFLRDGSSPSKEAEEDASVRRNSTRCALT